MFNNIALANLIVMTRKKFRGQNWLIYFAQIDGKIQIRNRYDMKSMAKFVNLLCRNRRKIRHSYLIHDIFAIYSIVTKIRNRYDKKILGQNWSIDLVEIDGKIRQYTLTKFTNIYQKQRHLHNPSYRSEWMAQILGRNHHQNHLIAVTRPYRGRSDPRHKP